MASSGIVLKNLETGETRAVEVGWSWGLFLGSGVLGAPLFARRLHFLGGIMLLILAVAVFGPMSAKSFGNAVVLEFATVLVFVAFVTLLGIKGNEMTAKGLLEDSWTFADPHDPATLTAMASWGIA